MLEEIGRYKVVGELGRGAMGVVYRAEDPAIGRTVAIKTIQLGDFTDPGERERLRNRLLREAQSAGVLSHPNIVTVYDIAEQGDLAYIFMEFVEGNTLEKLIGNGTLPAPKQFLKVLEQAASALDYAHSRGIVHRDIKPGNIMVTGNMVTKITDFGVAKMVSQQMTQSGALMGTPAYMAPEQILGHPVDGRTDQYALAVVVYEALTGEKPFESDTIAGLIYRIAREEPPLAQRVNATLNGAVGAVLKRALSKEPEKRFPNCQQFVEALTSACESSKNWKPMRAGQSQAMPTVVEAPVKPEQAVSAARSGGLAKLAAIGLGVVVLLAVAWVATTRLRSGSDAGAPAPAAAPESSRAQSPPNVAAPAAPPPTPQATAEQKVTPSPAAATTERAARVPAKPSEAPLELASVPPGADIQVDDVAVSGPCSPTCTVTLPVGRHVLKARMAGYEDAVMVFNTPQESSITVRLRMFAGKAFMKSDPAGAAVFVDGKPLGLKTPAQAVLAAGHHTIRLVAEGYQDFNDEVDVKDGALVQLDYKLVPR